jgi:N-acetylglucosaminyldiphosphoundecaprenol N-acetyl-beta-D-mannosaminyltransferase
MTGRIDRLPSVYILGVRVDFVSQQDLQTEILDLLNSNQKKLIMNVNAHGLKLASELPWLRRFLNSAHLVICDGYGVAFASLLLGQRAGERITITDWIYPLSDFAAQHGYSLFFLGGEPGVAEKAASHLEEIFPTLQIAGIHHGFFDKRLDSAENRMVIEMINAARPQFLLVCLGMPLQERWLMENWKLLDVNIALTGGAVLDYVSGFLRRPPHWMIANKLEWLGRLIIEPRRLWKRYLIGIPVFLWRVFLQKLGLYSIEG